MDNFKQGREIVGVSKWKEYGKKMGFWDYFEKQIRDKIKSDLLKIADKWEIEDLRVYVEFYFNGELYKELKK